MSAEPARFSEHIVAARSESLLSPLHDLLCNLPLMLGVPLRDRTKLLFEFRRHGIES